MILWELTDWKLVKGRLSINLRRGKGSNGDPASKSSQESRLPWNESRALVKAKLVPQPFNQTDLANKAKNVKFGHWIASKAYEITSKDGETGKGVDNAPLNDVAKLNNDLKAQQLKKADWAIIKDALEVGVPGMENVAAHFMKQ
jgi:hypothetical protein